MENPFSLASLNVTTETEISAEHPRYSKNYKNEGKLAERQRNQRDNDMQRRKEIRDDWINRRRVIDQANLEDEDMKKEEGNSIEKEDENMEELQQMNSFDPRSRRKKVYISRFKDMLMFSDWLVDIPVSLSSEWTLMASPYGRRCLVVGHRHVTNVFYKSGLLATQFKSVLPGGGPKHSQSLTILDCICENKRVTNDSKFYVLDLLWWNDKMYTDTEFTFRQFFLRSKIEELNNESKDNQFIPLPTCPCLPEAMTEFMKIEFPYKLDGLLFYFNSAFYIPEQTPLVGWLKPWMLPEILGVPIPENLQENKHSLSYIHNYNKSHHHLSSAQLNAEKEKLKQDEEKKKEEEKKKQDEKKNEGENNDMINSSGKLEEMDLDKNDEIKMAQAAKLNDADEI